VENRGFWALEAPPKHEKHENIKSPIYKQNKSCCQVRGAFECRECVRTHCCMHSTLCGAFDLGLACTFDRGLCVRT
jgi:hypothetical protein